MDKIEQCVSDVVAIANGARDHEQAKARIKELLDDAKFQLGQCFSVAKRLRDQLRAVYNDVETLSAKQFLDELIEWLAAKQRPPAPAPSEARSDFEQGLPSVYCANLWNR
jgi:hypothetical protein